MKPRALVVVLGDLARSPRMQYHCISLAKSDYDVTVIANGSRSSGDKGFEDLEGNPNIKQRLISDNIDFKKLLPSTLAYLLRPIWQAILLILQLFTISKPHVIILQNPPSVPTLPVIYLYTRLVGSRLMIDWHNYGFSILKLNLGSDHPLVRIYTCIETYFGRLADAGFCVSEAMRADLRGNFRITYPLHVLYDKPPSHFKPLDNLDKHQFFLKIQETIPQFRHLHIPNEDRETRFTHREAPNKVMSRLDRPAIILSSTSWTEDEDFDLLLDALRLYDESVRDQNLNAGRSVTTREKLPRLVCVITGRGPLKAYYEDKIAQLNLEHIEFVLPWLSAEDYTKMVGSCDLGVSLHSSSSGVDLPMKVVDLFGCGVPVLAYKYKAINELVKENFYGLTFEDSSDLCSKITLMLENFHHRDDSTRSLLDQFRGNITENFLRLRWDAHWNQIAKPVLDQMARST